MRELFDIYTLTIIISCNIHAHPISTSSNNYFVIFLGHAICNPINTIRYHDLFDHSVTYLSVTLMAINM